MARRARLTHLLVWNAAAGAGLGLAVTGALVGLDPGGMGRLLLADAPSGLALALLGGGFAALAGTMVASSAVMAAGHSGSGPGGAAARFPLRAAVGRSRHGH